MPRRAGEEQHGKRSELAGIVVTAAAFRSRNRGRGLGSVAEPLPR